MIRLLIPVTLVIVLLVSSLLPSGAMAANISTVKLFYWPSSISASTSAGTFATWNAGFWGVDFRLEMPPNPLGFHLQYAGGSESGWTGVLAGATSGNDATWFADATWRWPIPNGVARAVLGYGSYNTGTNINPRFTSSGFLVGGEGSVRLPPPNSAWSFNASIYWYPSNSTSSTASSTTASASATDWSVSAQFDFATWPGWSLEGGYRSLNVGTGVLPAFCTPAACNYSTTGFYIALGKTFP